MEILHSNMFWVYRVPALSLLLTCVLVHLGTLWQERRTIGPELSDAHSPDSEKSLARSFVWRIYLHAWQNLGYISYRYYIFLYLSKTQRGFLSHQRSLLFQSQPKIFHHQLQFIKLSLPNSPCLLGLVIFVVVKLFFKMLLHLPVSSFWMTVLSVT